MKYNKNARAGELRAIYKKQNYDNKNRLNFKVINQAGLAALPDLVRRWLPDGKKIGHEWVALNPRRADYSTGSFKINMNNGKWGDFAIGEFGGDVISLAAYIAGIGQGEAASRLANMLGVGHE